MKQLLAIIVTLGLTVAAQAAQKTPEELILILEEAVSSAAKGDIASAIRMTSNASSKPSSPKELNAKIDEFRATYNKVAGLGELDRVERLSLVFTGESFFRLKVVEKREDGVILWTFIGYKFRDEWRLKGLFFNGNSDLMQLMQEALDPADAKPSPTNSAD